MYIYILPNHEDLRKQSYFHHDLGWGQRQPKRKIKEYECEHIKAQWENRG